MQWIVIALCTLTAIAWGGRTTLSATLRTMRAMPPWARVAILCLTAWFTLTGSDKAPTHPVQQLFRWLFWSDTSPWPLERPFTTITTAATQASTLTADIQATSNIVHSSDVYTLSFDWHAPNRLPYHPTQNVLGWVTQCIETNISGTLYADYYVAFNAIASTNPAVIEVEYAYSTANQIQRQTANVITSSYPSTVTVQLDSGAHTCYWYRVEVPPHLCHGCLRDHHGEALFGAPIGSGAGFNLAGTILLDDHGTYWLGRDVTITNATHILEYRGGICVRQELLP